MQCFLERHAVRSTASVSGELDDKNGISGAATRDRKVAENRIAGQKFDQIWSYFVPVFPVDWTSM